MALNIDLAPDEERKLEEKARATGRDLSEFVRELIRRELQASSPAPAEAREKTFDEILAPLREGWQQSSMTDDEITALFEETRNEVRRERRSQKGMP